MKAKITDTLNSKLVERQEAILYYLSFKRKESVILSTNPIKRPNLQFIYPKRCCLCSHFYTHICRYINNTYNTKIFNLIKSLKILKYRQPYTTQIFHKFHHFFLPLVSTLFALSANIILQFFYLFQAQPL